MAVSTKQRLLDAGLAMLLERGYHDMGIQAVLDATGTPRGIHSSTLFDIAYVRPEDDPRNP